MSRICVIGAGCVGLVTASAFAELGHQVTVLDIDLSKVRALKRNMLPLYEPDLHDIWVRNKAAGRLQAAGKYEEALRDVDFAFIAVGTPSARNGKPSIKWVRQAARSIAAHAGRSMTVVIKSTVPLGTAAIVNDILEKNSRGLELPVVSNPDFMRKGTAVFDFLNPYKVVVGGAPGDGLYSVAELYRPLNCQIVMCDSMTAEMSKYASNVFVAARVGLMNELGLICEKHGADMLKVSEIISEDPRYGVAYLDAGLGCGGHDISKDLKGLLHTAVKSGLLSPILSAVNKVNQRQPKLLVNKLAGILGSLDKKTVGILGLAHEPGSDDMRDAPSLNIISLLKRHGCSIRAYDPLVMRAAPQLFPGVTLCRDVYDLASGCDALMLVTEWEQFKDIDFTSLAGRMKRNVLVDGRNFFRPDELRKAGFIYGGVGIPHDKERPEESSMPVPVELRRN